LIHIFCLKSCHQPGILVNSVPCNHDSEEKRADGFYSVTGQWRANFQGKIIQATVVLRHRSVATVAMFYMRTSQVAKNSGRCLSLTARPAHSAVDCFLHCAPTRASTLLQRYVENRRIIATNWIVPHMKRSANKLAWFC
jgi:hypothetical protein